MNPIGKCIFLGSTLGLPDDDLRLTPAAPEAVATAATAAVAGVGLGRLPETDCGC